MFAELLHCSNMAVLNSRPIISVSADGTVKVPTVATDVLTHSSAVVTQASETSTLEKTEAETTEVNDTKIDEKHDTEKTAEDKDASKPDESTIKIDETEKKESASEVDDLATPRGSPPPPAPSTLASSTIATLASNNTMENDVLIPVGDFLKLQFVDHRIIPTCFDLFFQFPWNNFLHTVVYDMVHQVFHRPMGDIGRPDQDGTYIPPKADQGITEGWNRRLTISIFKDGQLTKRITDAQRLCDYEW